MLSNGRKLIYIPILHTEHDMGSLSGEAKKEYIAKLGKKLWTQHVKSINDMWSGIKKRIMRLKLPYKKVYIYQDGLPVCGKEKNIVEKLASDGNPNHLIIKWLTDHGATIVGTENPQLLIEEYTYIKEILKASDNGKKQKALEQYKNKAKELLEKRDFFIKERINTTLLKDGTGLLFIGLLHKVDEILPDDIQVSYLIYHLPFKISVEGNVIT